MVALPPHAKISAGHLQDDPLLLCLVVRMAEGDELAPLIDYRRIVGTQPGIVGLDLVMYLEETGFDPDGPHISRDAALDAIRQHVRREQPQVRWVAWNSVQFAAEARKVERSHQQATRRREAPATVSTRDCPS